MHSLMSVFLLAVIALSATVFVWLISATDLGGLRFLVAAASALLWHAAGFSLLMQVMGGYGAIAGRLLALLERLDGFVLRTRRSWLQNAAYNVAGMLLMVVLMGPSFLAQAAIMSIARSNG